MGKGLKECLIVSSAIGVALFAAVSALSIFTYEKNPAKKKNSMYFLKKCHTKQDIISKRKKAWDMST